jgi:hypothetical protein
VENNEAVKVSKNCVENILVQNILTFNILNKAEEAVHQENEVDV